MRASAGAGASLYSTTELHPRGICMSVITAFAIITSVTVLVPRSDDEACMQSGLGDLEMCLARRLLRARSSEVVFAMHRTALDDCRNVIVTLTCLELVICGRPNSVGRFRSTASCNPSRCGLRASTHAGQPRPKVSTIHMRFTGADCMPFGSVSRQSVVLIGLPMRSLPTLALCRCHQMQVHAHGQVPGGPHAWAISTLAETVPFPLLLIIVLSLRSYSVVLSS